MCRQPRTPYGYVEPGMLFSRLSLAGQMRIPCSQHLFEMHDCLPTGKFAGVRCRLSRLLVLHGIHMCTGQKVGRVYWEQHVTISDGDVNAGEAYFLADEDVQGSQSGPELAHAIHEAVGNMLDDTSKLPLELQATASSRMGQVDPSRYPSAPSRRAGPNLDAVDMPAPYQAGKGESQTRPALVGGKVQIATTLHQFMPNQAAVSP